MDYFLLNLYDVWLRLTNDRTEASPAAKMEERKTSADVIRVKTLLEALAFLMTFKTRQERNEILEHDWKKLLPEADIDRYEKLRDEEYQHIKHVRKTYDTLFPEAPPCRHDYTKDEFYIFITVLAFGFKLKEELHQELWQSELDRHCGSEPHHPEYESLHMELGPRIKDSDVAEMACDRLSRNLQLNGGEYNDEDIKQYEPKFSFDHERRLEMYRKYVKEHKPTVKKVWDDMKPKL